MNWDLNLAFDTANVGGAGRPGGPGGFQGHPEDGMPEGPPAPGGDFPEGNVPPTGGPAGPDAFGSNVLVDRFMNSDGFAQLYGAAVAELTDSLFASGAAEEIVQTWVDVLSAQAGDLVDDATIEVEAEAIRTAIEGA